MVFSYCVLQLKRATQQKRKQEKTSPQQEIVFTVYSKCKVGNANDCHVNWDEAAGRKDVSTCY